MLTCMVYVVGGREMQGMRRRRRNTWNLLSPDRMDMERRASRHHARMHATSWCPCRRRIYGGSSIVDRDVACAQHGSGCVARPGNNESRLTCRVSGCWQASCSPAQQHPSRVHVRSPLSISVSISISAAATTTVDSARLQPHLLAS